jgi:hypothetical protein
VKASSASWLALRLATVSPCVWASRRIDGDLGEVGGQLASHAARELGGQLGEGGR